MIRSASGSLRDDAGTGAGGRATFAAGCGALAGFAGTATRSPGFNSVERSSGGLNPEGLSAASAGRGRGTSAGTDPGAAALTAPNIGDGWRPACMKTALATMAP